MTTTTTRTLLANQLERIRAKVARNPRYVPTPAEREVIQHALLVVPLDDARAIDAARRHGFTPRVAS